MQQAGTILATLARELPDTVLQKCIPDLDPGRVRKILQEAGAVFVVPREEKPKPSPQSKLWQDKKRDWKGRLQGEILQLYTDGASRGNPGEAGAGITILDALGNELVGTGKYLGQCTNNEAEYRALLLGIARCREFGSGRIKIHLDSELVVRQVRGEYRVKHPTLIPLFQQVMQGLSDFASYSITHVRRAENSRADELANQAIDERKK